MTYSLSLDRISKKYDGLYAVKELSLQLSPGVIFGLLGPNGAGKTSTIRMIMNITIPDEGRIQILGKPMNEELKKRLGYLPEERGLYPKMEVAEQLLFLAQLKGIEQAKAKARIDGWLDRLELGAWKTKKVEELSKGMQQKAQFIATVAHDPDLIILDEPFAGLDPINVNSLKDIILEMKNQGKTILFSTHRMEQVEKLCDKISLINRGQDILSGDLRAIKQQYGKDTVMVEYEGSLAFLNGFAPIAKIDDYGNYAEIKLTDRAHAHEVLKKIVNEIKVYKFEMVEPSLNEIFIERVGSTHE
ncbi:MAG: ATP-binding cassette domain-containing protein [Acidobacteria bacterium]|nr:ATP-binding cassette domain-containing protein [Acidobacteriota bacterium]MBI3657271.1 ATP-binding cassette domain-containing protein [Acidobacteriota bacterium]